LPMEPMTAFAGDDELGWNLPRFSGQFNQAVRPAFTENRNITRLRSWFPEWASIQERLEPSSNSQCYFTERRSL
jgi:hypothetical protein